MWIAKQELPASAAHPFYTRLNELLDAEEFDEFAAAACKHFYAKKRGRPSLTPGLYFRALLVGYFEGIDSERGIAWRASDSLGTGHILGIGLDERSPDHSTLSRTRRMIDVETHEQVFGFVLRVIAARGLLKGKTIGVVATTLEANAAMRNIVRRDTGNNYQQFLTGLAKESRIKTPAREQLSPLDRKQNKRMSNEDWEHTHDPDARIAKMKDGSAHIAHTAEHAVDLETGAIVALTLQGADLGDTTTMRETVAEAGKWIAETAAAVKNEAEGKRVNAVGPHEVVADKGYHSHAVLRKLGEIGVRSYIPEPERGRRRRRRPFVGTGGRASTLSGRLRTCMRRGDAADHLRGRDNIRRRILIHANTLYQGLVLRGLFQVGAPPGVQGRKNLVISDICAWHHTLVACFTHRCLDYGLRDALGPKKPFMRHWALLLAA
ncbi:MAG: transposase [Acidobacteriaceae bacterium]|nr:transposase [Acidobacteriaceae bacterium]